MIFIDGVHMVTDGEIEELHNFAESIGLKRCWFHNPRGKKHPHYDFPHIKFVAAAINKGAKYADTRDIVRILREVNS